jgi:hypothetical protein
MLRRYCGRLIALAARHRLPAIYPYRYHAVSGGLMSYGAAWPTCAAARPATSPQMGPKVPRSTVLSAEEGPWDWIGQ